MALWLKAAIQVCTLTSEFLFGGLGAVALIHKLLEITRYPTLAGRDPIAKGVSPRIGTFLWLPVQ